MLQINGGELRRGESPGSTRGLNLRTPLYLGGVDTAQIEIHSEVGVKKGFTGCISEVSYYNEIK